MRNSSLARMARNCARGDQALRQAGHQIEKARGEMPSRTVSCLLSLVSCLLSLVSCLLSLVSCALCLVFGVWCLVFGVWCLVFGLASLVACAVAFASPCRAMPWLTPGATGLTAQRAGRPPSALAEATSHPGPGERARARFAGRQSQVPSPGAPSQQERHSTTTDTWPPGAATA